LERVNTVYELSVFLARRLRHRSPFRLWKSVTSLAQSPTASSSTIFHERRPRSCSELAILLLLVFINRHKPKRPNPQEEYSYAIQDSSCFKHFILRFATSSQTTLYIISRAGRWSISRWQPPAEMLCGELLGGVLRLGLLIDKQQMSIRIHRDKSRWP